MLYLAEVQKKARVIGSGKTELKLLACQRTEQSWSAVPNEDLIPAPDDMNYNAGALVMVELTATKQIQRHSEAGRQLVSILQNFSRLQEKFKTQEEEIEQWKQSLTYQSQELNRREMEMETRREQLEQMEEDLAQLEQQRQDVEAAREEVDQLRQEFDRKSQDLEGAWAQLNGEMRRLEEQQEELQQTAVLDEEQAQKVQELLNRLSGAVAPTEAVREQLNLAFEAIAQQQDWLTQRWQDLEQQRGAAQQQQEGVDRQAADLQGQWQQWKQAQDVLVQARADLKGKQSTLSLTEAHVEAIATQVRSQETLYQQVYHLTESGRLGKSGPKFDMQALELLSLEDLQRVVSDLKQDLEKVSRFVNSQEEELTLQQDDIDAILVRMQQVSDYDRMALETELADQQDRYQMLNETLVGQRRNLLERESVLKQHQAMLLRRQGHTVDDEDGVDLEPVLKQIEVVREQQSQLLHAWEVEMQQLQRSIGQAQEEVDRQAQDLDSRQQNLQQQDQQLRDQRSAAAELWGWVNAQQELLQPVQDGVDRMKQKLEAIAGIMAQFQEASDYQLQAIAEMQQTITNLAGSPSPELAAS